MKALIAVTAEKDIPRQTVMAALEEALTVTYRKKYGTVPESRVSVDVESGAIVVLGRKSVVIDVRDERIEISLKDAQFLSDPGGLGDTVEVDITPEDFGRVGAQSAKGAILQRIHDAEREIVFREFADKQNELLTGLIRRIEPRGLIIDLGRAEGIVPPEEQVARERYRVGQRLRLYCTEINKDLRVPTIVLSRSHRNLLKRLFEVEVPEILTGMVEVRSIAREAGSRSKIAVYSHQHGIDAVGACVGLRGSRIQAVVNELNNEKVDVIQYDEDPTRFVANALSPAEVNSVTLDHVGKKAVVVVQASMVSLAIGKEGQNARLATKLTGWGIDIKWDDGALVEPSQVNAPSENAVAAKDASL